MFVIASVGTFSTIVHFLEGNCCETMYSSTLLWSLCGVRNIPLSCAFRQIILRLKGGISNVFNMYIYGLEVNVITGYPQILKIQFFAKKMFIDFNSHLRVKKLEDRENETNVSENI